MASADGGNDGDAAPARGGAIAGGRAGVRELGVAVGRQLNPTVCRLTLAALNAVARVRRWQEARR